MTDSSQRFRSPASFAGWRRILVVAMFLPTLVLLPSSKAGAQCPIVTDSDTLYLMVFPADDKHPVTSPPDALVVVMADGPGVVNVQVPACGIAANFSIAPGAPVVVEICSAAEHQGTGVRPANSITVAGVGDVIPNLHVVFKHQIYSAQTDDAYLVLPVSQLGSRYRSMCYPGSAFGLIPGFAQFTVAAHEPLTLFYSACGGAPAAPVSLIAGDTFQYQCTSTSLDCSGQEVSSSGGRFAFVTGSSGSQVPILAPTAETLTEMPPPADPTSPWAGTEYFTTEFNKAKLPGFPGDMFRITAIEPVSTIDYAADPPGIAAGDVSAGFACPAPGLVSLSPGQYCDINMGASTSPDHRGGRITANGRVMVAQYMKGVFETNSGDPSMMMLVPAARFRCSHRFFSFFGYEYKSPPGLPGHIDGSYVNIVAPASAMGSVQLDCMTLTAAGCDPPKAIPGSSPLYQWTRCRLPNPCTAPPVPPSCASPIGCPYGEEHTVVSSVPIGVYVYGQAENASAYSYPAGMAFQN